MQENIIIQNPKNVEEIQNKIISGGANKLQVIADFDNTLTYAHRKDGKRIPSLISVLRDGNYISKEYSEKAHKIYNKYNPTEHEFESTLKWWTEHFDLLIKSGLNKKHLEDIANSGIIRLREGIPEIINYLHEKNIPLIILSSSGVGDALKMFLENKQLLYNNVHLITNFYNWDEKGNAISVKEPIIHGNNKDETSLREMPKIYENLKYRKNIILLGDNKGDLDMSKGSKYETILTIGFLNENIEERLEEYRNNFDVVITNDSNANYVNELLKKVN
jgi:5'-nucleotidase